MASGPDHRIVLAHGFTQTTAVVGHPRRTPPSTSPASTSSRWRLPATAACRTDVRADLWESANRLTKIGGQPHCRVFDGWSTSRCTPRSLDRRPSNDWS